MMIVAIGILILLACLSAAFGNWVLVVTFVVLAACVAGALIWDSVIDGVPLLQREDEKGRKAYCRKHKLPHIKLPPDDH